MPETYNLALDTDLHHLCTLVKWLDAQEVLPNAVHSLVLEHIIEMQENIVDALKPARIETAQ